MQRVPALGRQAERRMAEQLEALHLATDLDARSGRSQVADNFSCPRGRVHPETKGRRQSSLQMRQDGPPIHQVDLVTWQAPEYLCICTSFLLRSSDVAPALHTSSSPVAKA